MSSPQEAGAGPELASGCQQGRGGALGRGEEGFKRLLRGGSPAPSSPPACPWTPCGSQLCALPCPWQGPVRQWERWGRVGMGPDSPAVPPHPRSITPSPPTWHLSLHPSNPVQSRPGYQALSYLSQLHPKIQPVTPSTLLPLGPSSLLGNKQGFLLFPTQIPAPVRFMGWTPIHVCLSLPRSTPNPIGHWDPKPPLLSLVLYGQMVWLLNPQVLPHPGDSPHPALNWLLQSCHLMPPKPLKIPEFQLDIDASLKTDCLVCDQVGLPSGVGGFGSVSSSPFCSRTSIPHL